MLYQGETLQLHWLDNGIAELVFNAPGSVNKLDTRTVASLGEALAVLEKQTELKGLLLRSTKAGFIVGADITEFLSLFAAPAEKLQEWLVFANSIFNRLEDLPVPTLSAINGYALGGGCECVWLRTSASLHRMHASACQKPNWVLCRASAALFVCRACWVTTAHWKSSPRVKIQCQRRTESRPGGCGGCTRKVGRRCA